MVTVEYDLAVEKAAVEVYDISGRSINRYSLTSSKGELQLNTDSYPSGVYLIVVKEGSTVLKKQKLVILKQVLYPKKM